MKEIRVNQFNDEICGVGCPYLNLDEKICEFFKIKSHCDIFVDIPTRNEKCIEFTSCRIPSEMLKL